MCTQAVVRYLVVLVSSLPSLLISAHSPEKKMLKMEKVETSQFVFSRETQSTYSDVVHSILAKTFYM